MITFELSTEIGEEEEEEEQKLIIKHSYYYNLFINYYVSIHYENNHQICAYIQCKHGTRGI